MCRWSAISYQCGHNAFASSDASPDERCSIAEETGKPCVRPNVNYLRYDVDSTNVSNHEFRREDCPNHDNYEEASTLEPGAPTGHELIITGFENRVKQIRAELADLRDQYFTALEAGGDFIAKSKTCHTTLTIADPSAPKNDPNNVHNILRHLDSAMRNLRIEGGTEIDPDGFRGITSLLQTIESELSPVRRAVRVAKLQARIAQQGEMECARLDKLADSHPREILNASATATAAAVVAEIGKVAQTERRFDRLPVEEATTLRASEFTRVSKLIRGAGNAAAHATARKIKERKELDDEKAAEVVRKIEAEAEEKKRQEEAKTEAKAEELKLKKEADAAEQERRKAAAKEAVAQRKAEQETAEATAKEAAAKKVKEDLAKSVAGAKAKNDTKTAAGSAVEPAGAGNDDDEAKEVKENGYAAVSEAASAVNTIPLTDEDREKAAERRAEAAARAADKVAGRVYSTAAKKKAKAEAEELAAKEAAALEQSKIEAEALAAKEAAAAEAGVHSVAAAEAANAKHAAGEAARKAFAEAFQKKIGKDITYIKAKDFEFSEGALTAPHPDAPVRPPKPEPAPKPDADFLKVPELPEYTGPPSLATLGTPEKSYNPFTKEVIAQDLTDVDIMAGYGPDDFKDVQHLPVPEPRPRTPLDMGAPPSDGRGIVGSPGTALTNAELRGAEFASPSEDPPEIPIEVDEELDPLGVLSALEMEKVLEDDKFKQRTQK